MILKSSGGGGGVAFRVVGVGVVRRSLGARGARPSQGPSPFPDLGIYEWGRCSKATY